MEWLCGKGVSFVLWMTTERLIFIARNKGASSDCNFWLAERPSSFFFCSSFVYTLQTLFSAVKRGRGKARNESAFMFIFTVAIRYAVWWSRFPALISEMTEGTKPYYYIHLQRRMKVVWPCKVGGKGTYFWRWAGDQQRNTEAIIKYKFFPCSCFEFQSSIALSSLCQFERAAGALKQFMTLTTPPPPLSHP